MQSISHDNDFDAIERRIRTLTTILQNLQPKTTPDALDSSPTPGLLDHLVKLFQNDDNEYERDGYCGSRMALSGVQTPDGLRITAVTENASGGCDGVQLTRIAKSDRTFDELVNGCVVFPYGGTATYHDRQPGSSVTDRISDTWTALSLFEQGMGTDDLRERFHALIRSIVARNFKEITSLLREINSPSTLDLSSILLDWDPQPYDLQESRWVCVPSWLSSVDLRIWHNRDLIEQCPTVKTTKGKTQWELSSVTAKGWVGLLGGILDQLVSEVQRHEALFESDSKDTSALDKITAWMLLLSSYLHWEEGVLHTLLVNTSLSTHVLENTNSALRKFAPFSGVRVFTHLKKIVARCDALENLCFNKEYSSIRNTSQYHAACLIQIPINSEKNRHCSTREDLKAHFIKHCTPSSETLALFEAVLDENYATEFYGSIHAEAALMGLVNHFSPESGTSPPSKYGVEFKPETRDLLEEFIASLPAEKVIVLSDASPPCSCCRWLGTRLDCGFQLPSTNSGQFASTGAWTPPPVGVDTILLEELEANLLDELDFRLRLIKISTAHEQPDTASDDRYAATLSDFSNPEDREFEVSD